MPIKRICLLFILTFLPENVFPRRNYYISVLFSIGACTRRSKDSISSKYTVNCQDDLILLNDGFSCAVLYEKEQAINKARFRKYFFGKKIFLKGLMK